MKKIIILLLLLATPLTIPAFANETRDTVKALTRVKVSLENMAPKIRIQEYLNDAEVEASMLSNPMKKNALECVRLFRVWALSNELAVELGERTDNPEHVRNAEECLREL